jgi:hypothetical protein
VFSLYAKELDSVRCIGEPAHQWRSPKKKEVPAWNRKGMEHGTKDAWDGWRLNGHKGNVMRIGEACKEERALQETELPW